MLGCNDALKIISRLLDKREHFQTKRRRGGGEEIGGKIVIVRRPTGSKREKDEIYGAKRRERRGG